MGLNDDISFLAHMNNSYVDSSGVGDAPTETGNPAFDASNKIVGSHAGDLDGDDSVHWGNKSAYNAVGAWSAGLWFRPTTISGIHMVVSKGGASDGWAIYFYSNGFLTFAGGASFELGIASAVNLNTWHNVVVTKSAGGGSSVYEIYLDSVSGGTTTKAEFSSASPLTFGDGGTGGAVPLIGQGDEMVVWNHELTQGEINEFYNGGAGVEVGAASLPKSINHASPMGIHLPMEAK